MTNMPVTHHQPSRMTDSTRLQSPGHARTRVFLGAVLLGLLAGCATRPPAFPEPLRPPKAEATQDEVLQSAAGNGRARPRIEEGPNLAPPKATEAPVVEEPRVPDIPRTKPVALVLDGVPLGTFINVVFGMELGFGLQVDQAVRDRPDLVSLRLTEPHAPERLYTIAVEVLKSYGVKVTELGGVLRFTAAAQQGGGGTGNQLIVTRSLPDVPAGQRTVFVAMPLDVSQPGTVAAQVRSLFGNQSVTLTEMVEANALLISGPGDSVQAAMEAVTALDRTALRDKRSIRINPLYLPADLLAKELRDVLGGQGISVKTGPGTGGALTFVPVSSANALIVFSESELALKAAAEWAERLDQPTDDGAGGGVYLYAARHTTVETLLPVLQALVGTAGANAAGAATPAAGSGAGSRSASTLGGAGGQLAVDPIRNVIVYQGEAQRWRAIQGVLARLDQPARQVVIEVTVAEVTLTDEFSHGIEWALKNVTVDGMSGPLTALAGAATNTGGLVWQGLSSSGQVRAVLNLFGKDSRVSILSTPRLLVKSGETASIDVGTEVPIITSQATAPDLPNNGNNSSILQSIQYRKTGVLLEIGAVVHSGQRVDLKVSQEVSEATPTDTSEISSPSIFSRKLQTSLSLSDGESMLLGGLISSSKSVGKTKVPLLGDIPVVGLAFQNRRKQGTRTELLMLITPYVIEDAAQARAITDAIHSRFGSRESWPGNPPRRKPAPPAQVAPPTAPATPETEPNEAETAGNVMPSTPAEE